MKSTHLPQSVYLIFLCLVVVTSSRMPSVGQEYCETEIFEASCGLDEVIVMDESQYGRMRIGGCITTDLGIIGCHSDVLDITDLMCSGRRQCSIPVPNSMLQHAQPCPKGLKSYLSASYSCVKVVATNNSFCDKPMTLTAPQGNLVSMVTMENNCGSVGSKYFIRVEEGQTINITLMDFSRFHAVDHTSICHEYAVIKEGNRSVAVCRGKSRLQYVYTSLNNTVDIRVNRDAGSETTNYFILNYKAIGCPNPQPPLNGLVKRQGDLLEVSCKHSSKYWNQVCRNGTWEPDTYEMNCESSAERHFSASSVLAVLVWLNAAEII